MSANYSLRFTNSNAPDFSGGAPSAPIALTVTAVTDNSITLNWKNADSKDTSIEIQKRDADDVWGALATLSAGVETYSNTGLSANFARGYRVRAVNSAGNSPWSNVAVAATSQTGAILHTTANWQKVLRAWLGTFVSSDFDVTLSSASTDYSGMSDEEVWQSWYAYENRHVFAPPTIGFRRASSHFVLSTIENVNVKMTVGRSGFVEPIATAFYAFWNSHVNPQYDNHAIYSRAMVAVAVDMIEARYLHDTNATYRRSDYAGGWILKWTLPFWMYENHPGTTPTIIDENTRAAIREGIRRMWDNIVSYNAGGNGGGDLEAFQLRAMPYLYDLGIITLQEYKDRANRVISEIVNPRGGKGFYHDHGGGTKTGIDLAYEGIWFSNLSNAAVAEKRLVPGVTIFKDALESILDLLAYTTVIDYKADATHEQEGRINGPSHFNTGTPGGVGYQFDAPARFWNSAYITDKMTYSLFGWHRLLNYMPQRRVADRTYMIDTFGLNYAVTLGYNNAAASNTGVVSDATVPGNWDFRYFTDVMPELAIHNVSGLWTNLKAVLDADNDENLTLPPILRTTDYVKNYGHLLSAKLGNIAAISHSGPVVDTWAGNPSAMRGGVSAFWIKDRGIFVLGVGTGGQDDVPDKWTTHETWAVNTVSGTTSGGQFSEARFVSQGLPITAIDPVAKTITFGDSLNLTSLFKMGDKVMLENWGNGKIYYFTLAEDSTNVSNSTIIKVVESVDDVDILPYGGRLYSVYNETGDDYFLQETRSLIDSTKATESANSVTVSGVIVKRTILTTSEGVRVEVEFTSPGTLVTTDIWEQIPAYQGRTGDTYAIEYWNGSNWTTLSTTYVSTSKIRLTRNVGNGDVYAFINFDNPQRVKLSASQVAPGINSYDYVRNIKVQISDVIAPKRKKISYTLQASDATAFDYTAWAKRYTITLNSSERSADLTDYLGTIYLEDMPTSFWDSVKSNGGDIRMAKADGTRIPHHVVSINTTGETGIVRFKYSGVMPASSDIDIYLYCGNPDANAEGVSSVYGQYNTYRSTYAAVYDFIEDPSGSAVISDATGNTRSGSIATNNAAWVAGDRIESPFGKAYSFDTADQRFINLPSSVWPGAATNFTVRIKVRVDASGVGTSRDFFAVVPTAGIMGAMFMGAWNTDLFNTGVSDTSDNLYQATDATEIVPDVWYSLTGRFNSTDTSAELKAFSEGVEIADANFANTRKTVDAEGVYVGNGWFNGNQVTYFQGDIAELMILHEAISDAEIAALDTNVQDPTAFYTIV